jgi:hypothetical protein
MAGLIVSSRLLRCLSFQLNSSRVFIPTARV